ncbi:MAG: damage-inducible protein DinB [Vicinamibacterales bacterium]
MLDALLDSWDRNHTILINLLRLVPEGGLEVRAIAGGPSVAELFTHIHYARMVFVLEDAPEFAKPMQKAEWKAARNADHIEEMLNESAAAVRAAVRGSPITDQAAGPVTWQVWMNKRQVRAHGPWSE